MAQFTVYSSVDAGGPGNVTGQVGDLIRVLDLVLVVGYAGKAAAGWSHPVATAGNIASYRNASPANGGNGFGFVLNDNGPNATSTYKEAWATGWETVVGVGAPVGTGTGQFPTPAQLLTTGHVVVRKSASADATGRAWVCFADSLTMYLFILAGDATGGNSHLWFGDFFSLAGNADDYRCMISGRSQENSSTAGNNVDNSDMLATPATTAPNSVGCYCPRDSGGGGTSIHLIRIGATGLTTGSTGSPAVNVGLLQAPNGTDNAYYLPPIWLMHHTANTLRGRCRGLYHSAHAAATFAMAQVVAGAADYAGKTLRCVKPGYNAGLWFVETSNTLETN